MKKSKKMALIMLAVMLMAVCFVFGASAAEPTFEDYVNAGVIKSSYQTIIRIRLNGLLANQPTRVYDFESGTFVNKHESEITDYYDIVPESSSEMQPYEKVALPYLTIPADLYSDGWYCVNTDSYLEGRTYEITYDDCGKIVEIVAANQPQYTEGNFSYIVTDGKAEIVKARGFEDGRVVIPDTLGGYEVKNIRAYAFNDVYEEFYVSEDNNYFSVDESGALFNKDKTKIYAYPSLNPQTSYKVPDSVEIIGTCAFMQTIYLKDLELPENLRIIEEQGIRSSWFALDEIYLSEKVEKLENMAIYDMPFLKKIYVEGMNTEFGETRAIGFIETYFIDSVDKDYCANLWTKYMQGDESVVEELAGYLEYPAESYYKATIYCHAGSTAEAYANANGINCETIHFFEGEWTYDYDNMIRTRKCIHCDELETEELEVPEVGDTGTWGDYEYIVLEDGTVEITKYNGSDTELVIPSELDNMTVKGIGDNAFDETDIVSVTISNGIIYIGYGAFSDCQKLTKVEIPESVAQIKESAFNDSFSLANIVVDENNSYYSSDDAGVLFNKDKTILILYPIANKNSTYYIPESVKTIESAAFLAAVYLNEIIIPEGVETIGISAFQQCYGLKSITIPNSVKTVKLMAFFGNSFVEKFVVESMDATFGDVSIGLDMCNVVGVTQEEFIDLVVRALRGEIPDEEITKYYTDEIVSAGTIYCHAGSTAEAYAIENGVKYELTHFFEGEWTYDYENNVRTRKCIHCDELETEELEIEELTGDNFLVVEETVSNGIEGDVEVLKAFDINLKNSEGVHVQPDGSIKVKLPNDWSKSGIYKVYRVNDDGTLTDMNAYREGSHLVFDTDHFSIYVIVFTPDETTEEEPETPDTPAKPDTSGCMCLCHKTDVFSELLMSIFRFLTKLLGVFPTCQCGVAHY